jgi:hypothetical protein
MTVRYGTWTVEWFLLWCIFSSLYKKYSICTAPPGGGSNKRLFSMSYCPPVGKRTEISFAERWLMETLSINHYWVFLEPNNNQCQVHNMRSPFPFFPNY